MLGSCVGPASLGFEPSVWLTGAACRAPAAALECATWSSLGLGLGLGWSYKVRPRRRLRLRLRLGLGRRRLRLRRRRDGLSLGLGLRQGPGLALALGCVRLSPGARFPHLLHRVRLTRSQADLQLGKPWSGLRLGSRLTLTEGSGFAAGGRQRGSGWPKPVTCGEVAQRLAHECVHGHGARQHRHTLARVRRRIERVGGVVLYRARPKRVSSRPASPGFEPSLAYPEHALDGHGGALAHKQVGALRGT